MKDQLPLFGASGATVEARSPAEDEGTRALAARLPRELRMGTSSWSFAGWRGIVWPDEPGWTDARCAREGLAVYARHPLLRTVGIDRSFYDPLGAETLRAYASQLPDGFQVTSKVWEAITVARGTRARGAGAKAAARAETNPRFLSVEAFDEDVIAPHRAAFAAHTGAFVLEFPAGEAHDPERFAGVLGRFLRGATARAAPFPLTVEIRDRRLLVPSLGRALASSGVPLCFTYHPTMPSLAEQRAWAERHGLLDASTAPLVARLMLPPGSTYEERRRACAPFDRIVDAREAMRSQLVDLVGRAVRAGRTLFVAVNNKAEGSAPLTIRALAERLAI